MDFFFMFDYNYLILGDSLSRNYGVENSHISGIIYPTKRKQIFNYLQNTNSDIILLQETHSSPATNKMWNNGTNFGVAILIKNKNINITQTFQDTEGRILNAIINHNKQKYQIINIYSPNNPQERPQFFSNITRHIQPNMGDILGGDFNMVLDSSMDREWGGDSITNP